MLKSRLPFVDKLRARRAARMKAWSDNDLTTIRGCVLLEVVLVAMGWGELIQPPRAAARVELNEQFEADYEKLITKKLEGARIKWPMVTEPNPWTFSEDGKVEGGYLLNADDDLAIRARKDITREQLKSDERSAWLKASDNINKTRYQLNPLIVGLLKRLESQDMNLASFVTHSTVEVPPMPEQYRNKPENLSDEEFEKWNFEKETEKSQREPLYRARRKELGRLVRVKNVMDLLGRFDGKDLYHSWSYDHAAACIPWPRS